MRVPARICAFTPAFVRMETPSATPNGPVMQSSIGASAGKAENTSADDVIRHAMPGARPVMETSAIGSVHTALSTWPTTGATPAETCNAAHIPAINPTVATLRLGAFGLLEGSDDTPMCVAPLACAEVMLGIDEAFAWILQVDA